MNPTLSSTSAPQSSHVEGYSEYTLSSLYHWYDASLFLSQRRLGIPIKERALPSDGLDIASEEGGQSEDPHDDEEGLLGYTSAEVAAPEVSREEEAHMPSHCARILANLRSIQTAMQPFSEGSPQPVGVGAVGGNGAADGGGFVSCAPPPTLRKIEDSAPRQCAANPVPLSRSVSPQPLPQFKTLPPGQTHTVPPTIAPLPVGQRRQCATSPERLRQFARIRVGKLLSDILLSCSAVAEGAGLTSVEDKARRNVGRCSPATVGSSDQAQTSNTSPAPDPLGNISEPNMRNFLLIRNSAFRGDAFDAQSDVTPFLTFDNPVTSLEDLTQFDEEDIQSDGGWRIETRNTSPSNNGRAAICSSNNRAVNSYALPAAATQHNFANNNGKAASKASRRSSVNIDAYGGSCYPNPHAAPKSPNSSMFKPALSFTSVESPRFFYPSAFSPQTHHHPSSHAPQTNATTTYIVDINRVTEFIESMKSLLLLSLTPEEFLDLNLKFAIPGISVMTSPANFALHSDPVSRLPSGVESSQLLSVASIQSPMRKSPQDRSSLGSTTQPQLPPKSGSVEGVDTARVSRMNSLSMKHVGMSSPTESGHTHSLQILDEGLRKTVTLTEFPVFLKLVLKTLKEVDMETGGRMQLADKFAPVVASIKDS